MNDMDYSWRVDRPAGDKSLAGGLLEILTASMSIGEKREVLSSWASDARVVPNAPSLRTLDNGEVVAVHEILNALQKLDSLECQEGRSTDTSRFARRGGGFLDLLLAASRVDRDDDDDDPPPCPAVICPLPRLPPLGMQAELEVA